MRRILLFLIVPFLLFPIQASATSYTAPPVPEQGADYMPENTESFAEGLWSILKDGISSLAPAIAEAAGICSALIGVAMMLSCVKSISETSLKVVELAGTLVVSAILLRSSNSLILLGIDTVKEISDYGNLLIPVLTAALAAQGGIKSSTALYAGTACFNAVLSWLTATLHRPLIYIYLILSVANAATGESLLAKFQKFIKWLSTWGLKIILYVFTGYMGLTKVVSGTTDAMRLKATKLTISGMVPVVGSILSDASESILVSAGFVKSTVGVYGLLAIAAVCIEPFLTVGLQYLLLKATASICEVFDCKKVSGLIHTFSSAMGFVLAMIGAECLMLLISIICFMKGVA